jgi:D-alanyl-D-alanine carboxypeptidase/D-alanyl-D-alanine-endopeptidase (penicillin-binding protein 4)
MIHVITRQVKRNPGDMLMARCDKVRCKKTVVKKRATWHTASPTSTATRIPGTSLRYPTYQVVDSPLGRAITQRKPSPSLAAMRRDLTWCRRCLARSIVAACVLAPLTALPAEAASGSQPEPVTGLTATPILSVRRVPGWVAETVAAADLSKSLAGILASPTLGEAARTSCLVVSQGGRVLYSANPTQGLIPASNMKLLTATAVLDRLGPSHRLSTTVASARPVNGVVAGNLYLIGGGDPLLRTPGYAAALGPDQPLYTSLAQLAAQVRAAGVQTIAGAVVGDESRYDQQRTVPTWSPVYAAEGDVAPLSALDVNDGTARSAPSPTKAGASAIALETAASANPAAGAATTFTDLLRADGIGVRGGASTGKAPAGTPVLTSVASPPLGDEVDTMLSLSDNTAAELFTKELGFQATGAGTTAAGVGAIRADLAARRLPVAQLVMNDGSGLDRGDRVTCSLLVADLRHLGAGGVAAKGLPVAGQTGTLKTRLVGTPAAGRLRAKTGTLDDVVNLSGFVLPKAGVAPPGSVLGQPIVFSLVLNGVSSDGAGRAVADQVGVALAVYPHIPALAQIEPRP